MKKVTKQEFAQAKRWLIVFRDPRRVARKLDRSYKTIVQIKNSKTYQDYREQQLSQHSGTNFSLRDEILDLHRQLFTPKNGVYVAPKAARRAIAEIKAKVLE